MYTDNTHTHKLAAIGMLTQAQKQLIQNVANLNQNNKVRESLSKAGYDILKIAWEDTSRTFGSCFGKNISDMSLVVGYFETLLPVIRKPNFKDMTWDVLMDLFNVPVYDPRKNTNEEKTPNSTVALSEFIQNIQIYVPDIKIKGSLFLPRDVHVLTTPQVCVLPLQDGSIEFGVQLYNYQSWGDSPAVLVIMICQQGTSVQVLSGKEILYFNQNGKAAWMNAVRLEDDRKARGEKVTKANSIKDLSATELEANTILVIQIPLKRKMQVRSMGSGMKFGSALGSNSPKYECAYACSTSENETEESEQVDNIIECVRARGSKSSSRGMDFAQVKAGRLTGENYKGVGNKELERDEESPIRVTIQGYITTDTADLTEQNINQIVEMLHRIEKFAESKGSLVTEKSDRLTQPGVPVESPFGPFKPQPVAVFEEGTEPKKISPF